MANDLYFPSLTETGWVKSSEITGDFLFAHFFASDYSQTQIYNGNVSSFANIMQKNLDSLDNLVRDLQSSLLVYYSRYFDNVVVEVNVKDDTSNISKTSLLIYVQFTDKDGKSYNLAKLIRDITSKSSKIIDINNNG